MGANCCIAAKNKTSPDRAGTEVSTPRNFRYSPSCSFRQEIPAHVDGVVNNHAELSHVNGGSVGSEIKSGIETEIGGLSDGGSSFSSIQTPNWHKSPITGRADEKAEAGETDLSIGSNLYVEEKDPATSLARSSNPNTTDLVSTPSTSSLPASSKKLHRSFVRRLYRQISNSRNPVLKSLNENDSAERRQSFLLSACSNDLSTGGLHGGSSDAWSMRMFSELIASSQRDRWSFDSENMSCGQSSIAESNSQPLVASPPDLQRCGVCSKLLKERSPWSSQKIVSNNELPVVAVLVCGHVYHAECLETVTPEMDRNDPPCLICIQGGMLGLKHLGKAELKVRSKISRVAVGDFGLDGDSAIGEKKGVEMEKKDPMFGSSSSLKSRPFLSRHFSIGSRNTGALSESKGKRKKGFWARQWKE